MYVIYSYNATTAQALLNDLVTLLTNTAGTDLTTLTTCVSAASSIDVTYNFGGWTLHDTPAAGEVVLKAPVYDNPNKFKYMYLDVLTAGYINVILYDAWDAVAHTGTYPATQILYTPYSTPSVDYAIPILTGTQATLYISASPRNMVFYANNGSSLYGPYGCAERSRFGAWDTPTNAFCNTVQFTNVQITIGCGISILLPYVVNVNVAGTSIISKLLQSSSRIGLSSIWGGGNSTQYLTNGQVASSSNTWAGYYVGSQTMSADQNLLGSYALTKINLAPLSLYGFEGGSLSDASDIYVLPYNVGNNGDTISANGKNFVQLGTPKNRFSFLLG